MVIRSSVFEARIFGKFRNLTIVGGFIGLKVEAFKY